MEVRCCACFRYLLIAKHCIVEINTRVIHSRLIDIPATDTNVIASAEASMGLDLGLKKAMTYDPDGLR